MATQIFLGKPHASIEAWIKRHQYVPPTPLPTHEETRYKYAGDTEWRTKMLGGTIALMNNADQSTGQIDNPKDIVAIEIGTGTQANPVTSIGNHAFYNCSNLTSVTIPDSVTSIGYNAFYSCSELKTFEVAAGNPSYKAVSGLLLTKDGKRLILGVNGSVTIPDGVTSIGNSAFRGCRGLMNVTIPNSVTSIGSYAFDGCFRLTSMTIPDGVTEIGDYAFCVCSGLTSVTIPNSVTSIEWGVFYGCSGLTSVTIGNGVTSIEEYAFSSCWNLMSVTIPGSVKSIGDWAFDGCGGLTSVTIPSSVTNIGDWVFYDCNNLSEMSMLGFTCEYVKACAYGWGISVPARQLVTIQCSDGYVILNDQSQSSDGKTNV